MLGVAPWAVEILYSAQFAEAASILRWQILGDILKVVSWPLGYVMLARGQGRVFMFSETFSMAIFVLATWIGLPIVGLKATGVGFLLMYVVYLPLVYWIVRSSTGFRWRPVVGFHLLSLFTAGVLVAIVASLHTAAGAAVGILMALVFGVFGVGRLAGMGNLQGPLGRLGTLARKCMARIGIKNEF
jgi:PST family polysaccharide transporter